MQRNSHQPLPRQTTLNGKPYQILWRNSFAAIYQKGVGENHHVFEVFLIKKEAEKTLPNGRTLSAREAFPKDKDFGRTAFNCRTLPRARARLKVLLGSFAPPPRPLLSTACGRFDLWQTPAAFEIKDALGQILCQSPTLEIATVELIKAARNLPLI